MFGAVLGLALGWAAWSALPHEAADTGPDGWNADERALLGTLALPAQRPAMPDPSNRVAAVPAAAALGKRLFFDPRLSRDGKIACASCHLPQHQFQDGRPLAIGLGIGKRRTMPVADLTGGPWFFWDGRKDSLWSQALGPLEDGNEHGGNRLDLVRVLARHYRTDYEALFGALPALPSTARGASPIGTPDERAAWQALDAASQAAVSRAFSNLGKAIAAYESTLHLAPSRVDTYIDGVRTGDQRQLMALSPAEKAGLRVFIGRGQCITCHTGPLLTDRQFHNIGVPPRQPASPDPGRADGVHKVLADEFNCRGPYSDQPPSRCDELEFIAADDPQSSGAFKTPGLRNVAERPPYMHAGQFATLEAVMRHYAEPPAAALGHSELKPVALTPLEQQQLVALMQALASPLAERPQAR